VLPNAGHFTAVGTMARCRSAICVACVKSCVDCDESCVACEESCDVCDESCVELAATKLNMPIVVGVNEKPVSVSTASEFPSDDLGRVTVTMSPRLKKLLKEAENNELPMLHNN